MKGARPICSYAGFLSVYRPSTHLNCLRNIMRKYVEGASHTEKFHFHEISTFQHEFQHHINKIRFDIQYSAFSAKQ